MCKALFFVGGYWEAVGEAIGRLLGGYWEAAGDPPTVNRSGSAKSCRRPRTQAFVSLGPRLVVRMMECLTDPSLRGILQHIARKVLPLQLWPLQPWALQPGLGSQLSALQPRASMMWTWRNFHLGHGLFLRMMEYLIDPIPAPLDTPSIQCWNCTPNNGSGVFDISTLNWGMGRVEEGGKTCSMCCMVYKEYITPRITKHGE